MSFWWLDYSNIITYCMYYLVWLTTHVQYLNYNHTYIGCYRSYCLSLEGENKEADCSAGSSCVLIMLLLLEVTAAALPHLCLMSSQQSAREHISPEGVVPSWHPPWSDWGWVEGEQKHWDRQKHTQRWTWARHPLRLFGFPATHTDVRDHWPHTLD